MAECIYCRCERLTSPDEPPGVGSAIICGACGSLMVLDVEAAEVEDLNLELEDHSSPVIPGWRAVLRRPTREEGDRLHKDPAVKRIVDAWSLAVLGGAGVTKSKKPRSYRLPRITLKGPDAK